MLSRHAVALIAPLLCARAGGYTWSTKTSVCARISGDQSNIWASSTNGFRWNFDLHVQFPLASDPDYMEKTVRVEFRRPLVIERIEPQGAATAINGGPNFVEVEVSPAYVGHEYFSIQGFREGGTTEDMLSPTITCSGGTDVPPPSPPHPADCDLAPEYGAYPLGGTREAGSDVTLKLTRWVPFRTFMLVYYGQEGAAVSKPQGVTIDHNPEMLGDGLVGFTFTLDPQGSDGLRCEGHPACIEFEIKPSPHHKPHITCIDSPPPAKPSKPPTAPPPLLMSPPPPPAVASPSFPPPVGTVVHASASCALGGTARVLPGATANMIRVAVALDNWINGYLVTLGVDGDELAVTRAAHAAPQPQGPELEGAARSFTFALGEEPVEMSAFAAILQAGRWGGLVAMTCSLPVSPPPPAARLGKGTGSAAGAYYGDDGGGEGSSSYEGQLTSHGARAKPGAGKTGVNQGSEDDSGGVGVSAALGVLLVILTMAGIGALVLKRGDMLQPLVDRVMSREGGNEHNPRPPARRKARARPADDGETESMVAASLDDDDEEAGDLQTAVRSTPTRAAADFDEPPLALAPARADFGISLDDDDDLQVGEASAQVILGRPEI